MKLFQIGKNNILEISPEAYILEPFKELWIRDKSKDKSIALLELAYIYFMIDYKSDFMSLTDERDRHCEVIKAIGLNNNWKPDNKVIEAMKFYEKMEDTISMKFLRKAQIALDKIGKFYDDVDLTLLNKSGSPVYNAKQLADTLKTTGEMIESLKSLEDIVKKEKEQAKGLRGSRKKGMYMD